MPALAFLKGAAIGFAIAAPIGPIGIMCIQRTLAHGRRCGFASGLGAATADAAYGAVAAFGLTAIADFLMAQQFWMRLLGGAFLCLLGLRALLGKPAAMRMQPAPVAGAKAYGSALFLTLTNPATVLSFAAVFAGLGFIGRGTGLAGATALVAGVFAGSALWWLLLSGLTGLLRQRLAAHLRWVNVASGLTFISFGLWALALACRS